MPNNTIQKSFCTTREAANILGISLSTAQLWVESGLLKAWKTEGGHRRIERASIERLLADSTRATPDPSAAMADRTPSIASKQTTFKILIVEDNDDLRNLYRINLSQWPLKLEIITASNGFEALIKIGNARPDLMIADLFMPDFDGFKMLKTVRAESEFQNLPIVVVTGLSPDDIATHGHLPEDIAVFQKPVPFAQLQRIAENLAS